MRNHLIEHSHENYVFSLLEQNYAHFRGYYPNESADFSYLKSKDPAMQVLLQSFTVLFKQIEELLDPSRSHLPNQILTYFFQSLYTPIPPLAIVQFSSDENLVIPRKSDMFLKKGTNNSEINLQALDVFNLYDVHIVPLKLEKAQLKKISEHEEALSLEISSQKDSPFSLNDVSLEKLSVHLANYDKAGLIYDLIFLHSKTITFILDDGKNEHRFEVDDLSCLQSLGFAVDEIVNLLEPQAESSLSLLKDYFSYPEKFMFFYIKFPSACREIKFKKLKIIFNFKKLSQKNIFLGKDDFALFCSPIVNVKMDDAIVNTYDNFFPSPFSLGSHGNQYTDVGFARSAKIFLNNGDCYDLPHIYDETTDENDELMRWTFYPLKTEENVNFYFSLTNANFTHFKTQHFLEINALTFNAYLAESFTTQSSLKENRVIYNQLDLPIRLLTQFNKLSLQTCLRDVYSLFFSFAGMKSSFNKDMLSFFQSTNDQSKNTTYNAEKIYSTLESLDIQFTASTDVENGYRKNIFKEIIAIKMHEKSSEGLSQFLISKLILKLEEFFHMTPNNIEILWS